jgi:hypothetical protein
MVAAFFASLLLSILGSFSKLDHWNNTKRPDVTFSEPIENVETMSATTSTSSTITEANTTSTANATHWRPTKEWVQKCIADLEQENPQPFHVLWRRYTLGDCIKLCRKCYERKCVRHPEKTQQRGSGCFEHVSRNDTFATHYHFRACKTDHHVDGGNLTIVDDIVQLVDQDPSYTKPPPDALVLHLRLGDVLENSKETVEEMLLNGADPWHVPSYRSAIKSIDEYLGDIQASGEWANIVIRGGSHDPHYYQKSRLYSGCLQRAIQTAVGAGSYTTTTPTTVDMKVEGEDPDRDFYYMSHAKHLIVSSGGYSGFIGTMVKRRGGRVIGREF